MAAVGRPIGWGRALVAVALAGAAFYGVSHLHRGHQAAEAAGSVLVRPVLQPVCGPWVDLAAEASRTRSEVASEATASRAAFEQANQIDPAARLGDAVSAVTFLDTLQEPAGAGASDGDVEHAVATLGATCRAYR